MSFSSGGTQTNGTTLTLNSVASATDGARLTTSAAHGLAEGDPVELTGTTDYDGIWIVSAIPTTTTFDILHQGFVFGVTRSGSVIPGDQATSLTSVTSVTTLLASDGGVYGNDYTVYRIPASTRLTINGLFYIDPEVCCVMYDGPQLSASMDIVSGDLIIGRPIVLNGETRYSKGTALVFSDIGFSRTSSSSNLVIGINGKLWWYGGVIKKCSGGITPESGAEWVTFSQEDCTLLSGNVRGLNADPQGLGQSRNSSVDVAVDGLTYIGSTTRHTSTAEQVALLAKPASFDNFRPIHMGRAVSSSSGAPNKGNLFIGFSGIGNTNDMTYFSGKEFEFRNNAVGSGIKHQNGSGGWCFITHEYTLNLFDDTGTEVTAEALWFYRDVDNGSRDSAFGTTPTDNNTDDLTYDGVSGDLVQFNVDFVEVSGSITHDYRLDNNNGTDEATVSIWSYLHLPTTVLAVMKGALGTEQATTIFDDTNLTQLTRATVAAYTTLTTGEQLYDRCKDEKVDVTTLAPTDSVRAHVEIPSLSTGFITGAGSNLDFGAISLVIDGAAVAAWALSGQGTKDSPTDATITIDAGAALLTTGKFNTITTTGAVTIADPTSVDDWTFNCDVNLNADLDISDVTINGDLVINNGAANVTLDFTNVDVPGAFRVSNTGTGTLTINQSGTGQLIASDPGTAAGETSIVASNAVTLTVLDQAGSPIENARIFLEFVSGGLDIFDGSDGTSLTNASGVATANTAASGAITGRSRKSSSSPFYKSASISGTISGDFSATITMLDDE